MQENLTEGSHIHILEKTGEKCSTTATNMWLSYIIPLYNCGEYIAICLDSVLAQGLEPDEYEVIVVNDGSTDKGPEIVARYCQKHDNFRLINKENGGVSSARNRGIDEARGEYIYFVDADDYILPNGMKTLRDDYLNIYGHSDIIKFMYYTVDKYYKPQERERISPHNLIFQGSLLEYGNKFDICGAVYSHVISKKLIVDNDVYFQSYLISEDVLFMLLLFGSANSTIIATNLDIYRYCIRENSAIHSRDKKHTEQVFYSLIALYNKYKEIQKSSLYKKEVFISKMNFCQVHAFWSFCQSSFSYTERKRMLHDAYEKGLLPIEEPVCPIHHFINKIYNHPFVVHMFSLTLRRVYIPFIKLLSFHNSCISHLTS